MKALVIGCAGFVGGYLIEELAKSGNLIYGTKLKGESFLYKETKVYDLDLLNLEDIEKVLNEIKPDYIYHLAAQSSVALSWTNPNLTIDINVKGTLNLLDTIRKLRLKSKVLLIGSSEEYGNIINNNYIDEEYKAEPQNIYAVSKLCQNMIGKIYAKAYNMNICSVRAFNHIGPKQESKFVVADFCRQVAEIERGMKEPVIRVGNLSAKRDFTDVRDIVRAYISLIEVGMSGETYNVGSGRTISIKSILDRILACSEKNIEVIIDKEKFRPIDVPDIKADISKMKSIIDWEPRISIEETIKDTLSYWRERI